MSDQDFVAKGSPSGWYQHPTENRDYFYTGQGFATFEGVFVSRVHAGVSPAFEAAPVAAAAEWVKKYGVAQKAAPVNTSMMVTTPEVPGFCTVSTCGLVYEIGSLSAGSSPLTGVASKAERVMDGVLKRLGEQASEKGANAIVGLTVVSVTGSKGGIMGDAVGVIVTGTAVFVERPDGAHQSAPR